MGDVASAATETFFKKKSSSQSHKDASDSCTAVTILMTQVFV